MLGKKCRAQNCGCPLPPPEVAKARKPTTEPFNWPFPRPSSTTSWARCPKARGVQSQSVAWGAPDTSSAHPRTELQEHAVCPCGLCVRRRAVTMPPPPSYHRSHLKCGGIVLRQVAGRLLQTATPLQSQNYMPCIACNVCTLYTLLGPSAVSCTFCTRGGSSLHNLHRGL